MIAADDTIFALSSGPPPAAIAIVRVSGRSAREVAERLAPPLPPPRRAVLRQVAEAGEPIDRALLLWFPARSSVTGEDLVEFHLHGGRAVVARMLQVLGATAGLRPAAPGEFSRRAVVNGRIDLLEAEALGDLLAADTETERRAALTGVSGAFGAEVERWRVALLDVAAQVEALLDHSDEMDVAVQASDAAVQRALVGLVEELGRAAGRTTSEELRDGRVVVLAGPPNSGKSSLLNALLQRDAALVTSVAGTTRDLIEATLVVDGVRLRLIDTAGLRETDDVVENLGVARAREAAAAADLVVWLGDDPPPDFSGPILAVHARCDVPGRGAPNGRMPISAKTGRGLAGLLAKVVALCPAAPSELVITARQRALLVEVTDHVQAAIVADDLLLVAEHLRQALRAVDGLTGRAGMNQMLDTLFARFCIGK